MKIVLFKNKRNFMKYLIFALILFVAIFDGNIKANQNNNLHSEEIFRAMQDEMNRSMNQLRLENLQKPYYMEYKISVKRNYKINGMLGQIISVEDIPRTTLDVVIRVGDYKFDQKNFSDISLIFGSSDGEERFSGREIPVELDYNTIRREFWLATDPAYKQAVEFYSKKEASLKNKIRRDTLWDFSHAKPIVFIDTTTIPAFNIENAKEIVKAASGVFNNYKSINLSSADLYFDVETSYFLNSEGTKYQKNDAITGIEIVAFSQAQDGMPLSNFYTTFAINPNDLPSKDSIVKATQEMAAVLENNINAPVLEDSYSGPILFINQAACEAFAQIFLTNFIAQREQISDGISFGDENRNKAFQNKIGGRVLPEFFSIEDLPNLKEFNKTKLIGNYKIDDDGIIPQDLLLVKDGYLKTLLSNRIPIKRIEQSNGRNRSGTTMFSNIKIDATQKYQTSEKELKNQIIKLCKQRDLPFGIIVKKIMNLNVIYTNLYGLSGGLIETGGINKLVPLETYKIYSDGREELVRGGILAGMSVAAFKDIIRTGNTFFVYNMLQEPINPMGGGSTNAVSIIGRSILFEDGELQTLDKNFKKPPFLENPIGLAR